jgi:uncharacterized protein YcbX
MSIAGKVQSLWRYPVKSMRGEELDTAFLGFAGVYGDRVLAFTRSGGPDAFPWLTGRDQAAMLLYSPRFRHADAAKAPTNLTEAEEIGPGLTPLYADPAELAVEVETPSGEVLAVDDPDLVDLLREDLDGEQTLSLRRSDRSMTDCRPVSLFSVQTGRQLGQEMGIDLDLRRFRANIYLDLESSPGFTEDEFVGRKLSIGSKAVVSILERDPRCKMICLDPDTAEQNPEVMKRVARGHDNKCGVYGAVLVEGMVRQGDPVRLLP